LVISARVLDAGATSTGRPFFVMELVKGVPITRYCEDHHLDNRQKLELFISVCKAIQHAHQKGIIHRDIKPSNIMVTLHDGVPVPKVIDFGIAKATQQDLTEKTIFTQYSQFIGTPAYMSPEQAEMSGLDIDTRSDIYSLGVVLYELLTGAPPFDSRDLMQSGIDEMRRIIREKDPVRPSTRVSALRSERRTVSGRTLAIEAKQSQRAAERAQTEDSAQRRLAEEKRKEAQEARVIAEKMQLVASQKSLELARRLYLMKLATADNALLENNYPQARLILDECEENQRGWEWEFLNNRLINAVQQLRPGLTEATFTEDETTIFAVDDKKIVSFEPRSGNSRVILEGQTQIKLITIDKKGRSLAWQPKGGDELGIWDLVRNEQKWFKKTGHAGSNGMAFSPDGNQFAIVYPDGWLLCYEVETGSAIYSKSLFNGILNKLEFSPDGRWILVGGYYEGKSSPGFLLEASTGNIVAKFPDGTVEPAFHPDGELIASGNAMEKRINLWTWDGTTAALPIGASVVNSTSPAFGNPRGIQAWYSSSDRNSSGTRLISPFLTFLAVSSRIPLDKFAGVFPL
jgi:serine/threonine protein kinase